MCTKLICLASTIWLILLRFGSDFLLPGGQQVVSEVEALSGLIGLIYEAAMAPGRWPGVIAAICAYLGASSGNIFWHDTTRGRSHAFYTWGVAQAALDVFQSRYAVLNPLFPAATFFAPDQVVGEADIIPIEEFRQTRFYREWVAPQGMVDTIGFNLQRTAAGSAFFTVQFTARRADAEQRRKLGLLAPHISRAALFGRMIAQKDSQVQGLEQTLNGLSAAVFLVDRRGRLAFANRAAEALVVAGMAQRGAGGQLRFADGRLAREMDEIAGSGPASLNRLPVLITLRHPNGSEWLAHMLPLSPDQRGGMDAEGSETLTAIFLRPAELDPKPPLQVLAERFGLTGSEIRVLAAMASNSTAQAIADRLGLSTATVRTHLHHLFAKTGTQRQSELVRLLAAHATPLDPPTPAA